MSIPNVSYCPLFEKHVFLHSSNLNLYYIKYEILSQLPNIIQSAYY